MKYQVDLSKKKIVYEESVPAGHIIALKKIFEPQGYTLERVVSIQTVDELTRSLRNEMQREFVLHGGTGGMMGHGAIKYSTVMPAGPKGDEGMPGIQGMRSSDYDYGAIHAFGKMFPNMEALEVYKAQHYARDRKMKEQVGKWKLDDAFDEAHDLQEEMNIPEEVRTLRQRLTEMVTKGKFKK